MNISASKRIRNLIIMMLAVLTVLASLSITIFAEGDETAAETAVIETSADATESEAEEETNKFAETIWSLLPPVIAIGLALITKEVYSSLFVGIIAGALMHTSFSVTGTIDTVVNNGFIAALEGCAGIFIFLVLLGMLVALINKTGASAAFGRWAEKNIKSRVAQ